MNTENAVIKDTYFGWEDHGILTFNLTLDYGWGGQGAGGIGLSWSPYDVGHTLFPTWGLALLAKVMNVVGVHSWEELKGKHVRAIQEGGMIIGLKNILKDDDVIFKDFIEERKKIDQVDRENGLTT